MKKSFTLKAFAFGAAAAVALSASATPHEFLKAEKTPVANLSNVKQEAPLASYMALKSVVSSTPAKAPANKAEANYGEWSQEGTGQYTFAQRLDFKTNFPYQLRKDNANPGEVQVLIKNWSKGVFTSTGTDLTLTITKQTYPTSDGTSETMAPKFPAGGVNTGLQGIYEDGGEAYPVYVCDYPGWLTALRNAGETWSDGTPIEDDDINQWYALFGYNETTGKAQFLPVYFLKIDGKPSWYTYAVSEKNSAGQVIAYLTEEYQMYGGDFKNYDLDANGKYGYFSHEKDAAKGTFTLSYNLNDNDEAWFRIVTGKKSGTALQTAMQELMKAAYYGETATDVVKVTEKSGKVSIPVESYRKGQYTVLACARYAGIEDGYFVTYSDNTIRAYQEDIDFYAAGDATYTDAMMAELIPSITDTDLSDLVTDYNFPEEYTVTVPVQANSKAEGEYRLVHPYTEIYTGSLKSMNFDYDVLSDYLLFNIADSEKSFIVPSTSGIYCGMQNSSGQSLGDFMFVIGSTNKIEGGNTISQDVWATFENHEMTFPEGIVPDNAQSFDDVTSALSYAMYTYKESTGVVTPDGNRTVPLFYPEYCVINAPSLTAGNAGVENVAADSEFTNAPVEYFNLQGIRVAAPEAGQLLIKVQGKKAEKVVIR